MLTLSRGGPIVWMSETDAKDLGIEATTDRSLHQQRRIDRTRSGQPACVPAGMTMMYHAQERIVNLPVGNTQQRGGIHNFGDALLPKRPMIGGCAVVASRL